MIRALLGRFFRHCMNLASERDAARGYHEYMTDEEITHRFSGRGHLINWNDVRRRQEAGQAWAKKVGAAI